MKHIEPYDFQLAAAQQGYEFAVEKKRSTLIVSPGGSGKTVIMALIAANAVRTKRSVLMIAHAREIVKQAYDHLKRQGLSSDQVSVIMAGLDEVYDEHASVQVASISTLRRRAELKLLKYPEADVILVDEAQHVVAQTYRALVKRYPKAAIVGLTATPWRLDGRGLKAVFRELIVAANHSDLIERGLMALPRMFVAPDEYLPVLDKVRVERGDYVTDELEREVNRSPLVGNVVDNWGDHAQGRQTLVFAVSIEHSRHLAGRFDAAGVSAEHLDGSMPLPERERILKDFRTGKIVVLCNCMVLAEGYDLPACKVAVFARPTKSLALYYQQSARAARAYGKVRPILLDHARNILEHGPPHIDRDFTLNGLDRKKKPRGSQVKVCPACRAVAPSSAKQCPECHEEFSENEHERRKIIEETDDVLIELTDEVRSSRRLALEDYAAKKEFPSSWVDKVMLRWCGPELK